METLGWCAVAFVVGVYLMAWAADAGMMRRRRMRCDLCESHLDDTGEKPLTGVVCRACLDRLLAVLPPEYLPRDHPDGSSNAAETAWRARLVKAFRKGTHLDRQKRP